MQFRTVHLGFLVPAAVLLTFAVIPLPDSFLHPPIGEPVRILDREGQLLYEWNAGAEGRRRVRPLAEMPPFLVDAIVAVEDRTFYRHAGVSLRGVARALFQNALAGGVRSGGSTITQQAIRIRMQPRSRTLPWKITEALLALKLEQGASKEQILETYMNGAYFGHRAYGVDAAARTYLGKELGELSAAETALVIGLLQSPSGLDPFNNPSASIERRNRVLTVLMEQEVLSPEEYRNAVHEPLRLATDTTDIQAPHFVLWLLEHRPEAFSIGRDIQTTLDLHLQREAERSIAFRLEQLRDKNVTSAAVVVLDAHRGDILAMVGSSDYFDEELDGAVNVAVSARQPGSALKPFTYALALIAGDTAATTVADTEAQFLTEEGNPYTPRNYDYGEHGLVRYRDALANSYNIAAVKVLERVGVERLLTFLRKAGITTLTRDPEHYGLALTLGAGEVRLLELTEAYGIFPRGGMTLHARGLPIDPVQPGTRILDQGIAWIITDILSDDDARMPEFGEDSLLSFPFPVAAKTGTTRNSRDNWTLGYTPDRIVGVWVGNADNAPMAGTSGISGAGPIFHDVMLAATKNAMPRPFTQPGGIVSREICRLSGKVPTPLCPHTLLEYFVAGTEPRELDDLHTEVAIDVRNGLRATDACPAQYTRTELFTDFPPDVRSWARRNGWKTPPEAFSPLCGEESDPSDAWITIERPRESDSFQLDPLVPNAHEHIIFEARAATGIGSAEWFVDDHSIGQATAPGFRMEWAPTPGIHRIVVRAGTATDSRQIEVTDRSRH